jgi:hypothetical protein
MNRGWTRREVLRASSGVAAIVGAGASGDLIKALRAAQSSRQAPADDDEIERLAGLVNDTEPQRVVDVLIGELRNGLSRQTLLAANFVGGMRYHGHHSAYVAHPVNVVSNEVAVEASLLPLFYHVSVLRFRRGRPRLAPLDRTKLPAIGKADALFHDAMEAHDGDAAARALIALARHEGPRRTYDRLWRYGAARNHRSGGHSAISVVNTFRTLRAIEWRCLEAALQFAVQDSAVGVAGGSDLHRVNWKRCERLDEMPPDWFGSPSDRGAVPELLALYREGKPEDACKTTFAWLLNGTVRAGTVWDAVFLTTAEMVARYRWVGPNMLAGHSVTCTNALNFMFRQVADARTRLYTLLEAVEWTTNFLRREEARPALRDRGIMDIAAVEPPTGDNAMEAIFALLPPRRFFDVSKKTLADVDRAMELAFAWAGRSANHRPFVQSALSLLCVKATPEVHDFKYPIALFENCRHASPEWRAHLLAASVYVLHGTNMEDSEIVRQARDRLRV